MLVLVLALALAVATSARDAPKDVGLKDQKNFISYAGVGGYSGIGSNGLPFGGAGIGGGTTGIGGLGGFGGPIGGGTGGSVGGGVGGGSIPHPTPWVDEHACMHAYGISLPASLIWIILVELAFFFVQEIIVV